MNINFSNNSNLIKRTQSTNNTYDKQISDSSNGNVAQPQTTGGNLVQSSSNVNFQLLQLSAAQNATLIKELLNIPDGLDEFLALFLDKSDTAKDSVLEFLNNPDIKLDLVQIKQLLDTNSKDVISKLIKIVQQNPGNSQANTQINDILSVLKQVSAQNKSQQPDTFKSVILLYLPYLPLTQPQNFKLGIEEKNKESSEETNEQLVILISTVNLGRFKITLVLNKSAQLKVDIELQEKKDSDNDFEKNILEKINAEISKLKLSPNTEFYQGKPIEKDKDGKRSMSFQQITEVSPPLMMSAYTIVKIIFEIDENESLLIKRKEMLGK